MALLLAGPVVADLPQPGSLHAETAATEREPEITTEDALAAYLEQIQAVLCSFRMRDEERVNAVASLVHNALLNHGGGYTDEGRARRERAWKELRRRGL